MKKINFLLILLILLIGTSNIIALSEKESIILCKQECRINEKSSIDLCNKDFKSCKNNCSKKDKDCLYECYIEKKGCLDKINFKFSDCSKNCIYLSKNITCGNRILGEIFFEGCDLCRCEYNKKINCKKTDFCNYDKVLRNKTQCISNKGLYQQLCNGPYFDIVCSKDNFCLCEGDNNYSCPEEYTCLHEFSLSLTRRGYTLPGWKTLLGKPLGNIGICAKKS